MRIAFELCVIDKKYALNTRIEHAEAESDNPPVLTTEESI